MNPGEQGVGGHGDDGKGFFFISGFGVVPGLPQPCQSEGVPRFHTDEVGVFPAAHLPEFEETIHKNEAAASLNRPFERGPLPEGFEPGVEGFCADLPCLCRIFDPSGHEPPPEGMDQVGGLVRDGWGVRKGKGGHVVSFSQGEVPGRLGTKPPHQGNDIGKDRKAVTHDSMVNSLALYSSYHALCDVTTRPNISTLGILFSYFAPAQCRLFSLT